MDRRKHHWILYCSICLLSSLPGFAAQTQITSIDFKGDSDPSEISIQGDGVLTFEKQENPQDKQIVIEFKGASISKENVRKIDTSSFNSKVTLISPYQVEGQDAVRVVIQLRDFVPVDAAQDGNTIRIKVPTGDLGSSVNEAKALASQDTSPKGLKKTKTQETDEEETVPPPKVQKFTGRAVTIQLRDADLSDVFRLIGDASGFNIVVGDDVKGKITLSLVDVPWDQALDVILHNAHLGAERNNNILRIATLQSLTQEKLDEYNAKKASEANSPQITRVFPISYANLTDLQGVLTRFASTASSVTASGSATSSASTAAAIVQIDNRTNSIIVRDYAENIERMKKLIEILDTQTPQVVIEAKIIEATEGFSKNLSGSLGLGGQGGSTYFASIAGGNPVDSLIGTPGVFAGGSNITQQSSPTGGSLNGTFGLSPNVSFIPGLSRLNALLSWGESENQLKIISSPKTVVLNKEKATIVEGTPVLVPGTTTVAGVGTVPTTSVQNANISLSAKPTVTNDGSVLMELKVSKDIPVALSGGQQGIGNRNLETLVLVDSGSTLVIGGIYTMSTNQTSEGIPFLRKIPILGALFGSEGSSTDRSELFIFVTPRIINMKEAGLNS